MTAAPRKASARLRWSMRTRQRDGATITTHSEGTEYFHNEATGETVWGDLGSGGMKDIGYRQRTRRLSHELSDDQAPLSPRSAGSALDTLPESIYDNRPADDFSRASAWRSIDTAPSPTGSYGSPPSLAKVVVRAVPTPPRPSMPCIIAEGVDGLQAKHFARRADEAGPDDAQEDEGVLIERSGVEHKYRRW